MEFRQKLYETLHELMAVDETICVLDADLSKPNGTFKLYKEYPERCFNVGIAEANMASIASGLSAYGFKPIILTFAPFATRRICDQLAVSIAYAKQKVIIVGTDPGITAEINGGTHMSFEDIAIVRSIPEMLIFDASDANQLAQALPKLFEYPHSVYIRMPRKVSPQIYNEDYQYHFLKSDIIKEGTDLTIIASGMMVSESLKAIELLNNEYNIELINANIIKPLDEETILNSIQKTKKVLVCENHNQIGGLTSAICELVCSKYPINVYSISIKDQFGQTGRYNELLNVYELTPQHIVRKIKEII